MEGSKKMEKILLGYGFVSIGVTAIGLTRGGSQFVVTRTNRQIMADGDKGPVKDRIVLDEEVPTLTLRSLTMLPADTAKMYPALAVDSDTVPGTVSITGTGAIASADYQDKVTWTGVTLDGDDVVITVDNAINLGNIDWSMVDKDEVVPEVVFTGTYLEADRTTPPYKIEYTTPV